MHLSPAYRSKCDSFMKILPQVQSMGTIEASFFAGGAFTFAPMLCVNADSNAVCQCVRRDLLSHFASFTEKTSGWSTLDRQLRDSYSWWCSWPLPTSFSSLLGEGHAEYEDRTYQ